MSKPKILVQLDSDAQASVFDGVVAIDAGVDQLFRHGGVATDAVRELVYGTIFTRGGDDLRRTAIFVGGSDVAAGEALLRAVCDTFFGPMRVSVMLDSNGANTTAAAAVLSAAKHCELNDTTVTVMAATGPVGSRVVQLLALEGATVNVGSRSRKRAEAVCEAVASKLPDAKLNPVETASAEQTAAAVNGARILISAGAPKVELVAQPVRANAGKLEVAIDLSAVPPVGLAGIEITDDAKQRDGMICYGAIGVGGTKMKIHKAAVRQLFEANDQVLDAQEIYRIGQGLSA